MAINGSCGSSGGGWSTGDSHDSGIGNSPPFEGIRSGGITGMGGNTIISNGVAGIKVKTLSVYQGLHNIHIYMVHVSQSSIFVIFFRRECQWNVSKHENE